MNGIFTIWWVPVEVEIWDWNSNQRDRQVIEISNKILQNQRATFDNELASMLVQEEAKMERTKKLWKWKSKY